MDNYSERLAMHLRVCLVCHTHNGQVFLCSRALYLWTAVNKGAAK